LRRTIFWAKTPNAIAATRFQNESLPLADFIGRGETKSMGEPAGRSIGAHAFHAVHRHLAEQRALPAAKTVERHRNWDGRARPSPRCHERIPNLPGPASRLVFKNQASGCAVDKQAPLAVC